MGAAAPQAVHVAPLPAGRRGCAACFVLCSLYDQTCVRIPDLFLAFTPCTGSCSRTRWCC